MYQQSNATNYLSKDFDSSHLKKEIMAYRCNLNKISMSIIIAIKVHPNYTNILFSLNKNQMGILDFTRDLMNFLFCDNSVAVSSSLGKRFACKLTSKDFIWLKNILMITFKEYGMSHVLYGRVMESFSDLNAIFVEKNEWCIEEKRKWWKMWIA